MGGEEQPQSNYLMTCGILILVGVICLGCLGLGTGGYYFRDNLGLTAQQGSTATPEQAAVITPTVTVTPIVVILPTVTASPVVSQSMLTPTLVSRPVQLPEPAASQYATLLVLEGNVFLLNYVLEEVDAGTMTEADTANFLPAIEQIFGTIRDQLNTPLPPDTDPNLLQAWGEAQNAFAVVDELTRLWSQGTISTEDVQLSLTPVQIKVQNALDNATVAFESIYSLDLETIRQSQVEAVRAELMTSAMNYAKNQAEVQAAAAPAVPVDFPKSDIPLSDNLFSSVAWIYAGRILQLLPNFTDAQKTIEEVLAEQPNPFISNTRQQDLLLTVATIQASSRIIKQIELQSRMGKTREILLAALLDCDTAALYLASGLKANPPDFAVGVKYLESCNEKLVQPKAELEAFISNNQTSGETEVTELVAVPACPTGCTQLVSGCIIKGDIDLSGNRAYYLPGHTQYGEISIEPALDERWFCSIAEARVNGWDLPGS